MNSEVETLSSRNSFNRKTETIQRLYKIVSLISSSPKYMMQIALDQYFKLPIRT